MKKRPQSGTDYSPQFEAYVSKMPEGELPDILIEQSRETVNLFLGLTHEQANHRYAPDKWSVKEVLGHMADTERVMSYRLLRIARGDQTPLAGFEENLFVNGADFGRLSLEELLQNYEAVRQATLTLIKGMPEEAWTRRGFANGHEITAQALAFIIAGHELHHKQIVQERYLS